ncbi:MAG: DUF348 domain-containing protein [Chloroflexi bacterium]|nr:DUF348 domain-containing protein [Chloroflexota bacterium]
MKRTLWLALGTLLLAACTSTTPGASVTIIDGTQVHAAAMDSPLPADLLAEAGVSLAPADRVLANGRYAALDQPLDCNRCTLQVRRALPLTLVTPDGEQTIETSALTVGQALHEAGIQLFAADFLDPPAGTAISGPLTVTYRPARELSVRVDGQIVPIRSSAETVGEALAGAGIPLEGLDTSLPSESDPLPADGQVRVVRVQESVLLIQKSIPFSTEFVTSAEVEIDQQEILQPGEYGLTISRVRVRYEDGQEVSRQTEDESTIRMAKNRIIGYGTKLVIRSTSTPDGPIEYWRAVRVYATSYSPCHSAADRCYYQTSSGKPVQKGVIGVIRSWYLAMQGQPVYIPGYGFATIEDVGAGIPGKDWIDLGYTDEEWYPRSEWVTLYFLTPIPANTMWVLE